MIYIYHTTGNVYRKQSVHMYENKRRLCKLCKNIDNWIVEMLIDTYFFIDSAHAMEYKPRELSFVGSSQNIFLSDRTCSGHFEALYNV